MFTIIYIYFNLEYDIQTNTQTQGNGQNMYGMVLFHTYTQILYFNTRLLSSID